MMVRRSCPHARQRPWFANRRGPTTVAPSWLASWLPSLLLASTLASSLVPTLVRADELPAPPDPGAAPSVLDTLPPQASGAVFEVGALIGVWGPSLVSGLGDAYYRYDVPGTGLLAGVRGGWQATSHLAIEAELRGGSGSFRGRDEFEDFGGEADLDQWQPGGSYQLFGVRAGVRYDAIDRGPVLPFVRAFTGIDMLASTKAFITPGWDADWIAGLGVGARFRINHRLRLRLDVEGWLSEPPVARKPGASTSAGGNLAMTAGICGVIGGPAADEDGDGIPDGRDRCPDQAEDKDGHADEDGCPDLDNDGDGLPDAKDQCPNEAEDDDQFEDKDGCPDPDNDRDGVPDTADRCPNEVEDKDGFQDEDGCPDPDNDGDGLPDAKDRCPNQAEDKDGLQDGDGCPEVDVDSDGVADQADRCPEVPGAAADQGCPNPDADNDGIVGEQDRCPNEAETWNGKDDADGCPDGEPLVRLDGDRLVFAQPLRFRGATVDKASLPALQATASLLARLPWPRIAIAVHGDDRDAGSKGLRATQARADAVVKVLTTYSVDASRLDGRGYGDGRAVCVDIAALLRARPKDAAAIAACRAANARVEVLHLVATPAN